MTDNVARALALIALKKVNTVQSQIGNTSIHVLTEAEYTSLINKDNNTLYIVKSDTQTILYIGNSIIGYGAGDSNIPKLVIETSNINNIIGNFQEVNER